MELNTWEERTNARCGRKVGVQLVASVPNAMGLLNFNIPRSGQMPQSSVTSLNTWHASFFAMKVFSCRNILTDLTKGIA